MKQESLFEGPFLSTPLSARGAVTMIRLSRSRAALGVAVLLAVATRSHTCRAQEARDAEASAGSHLHGLEIMVRPAVGAAPSDSPVRYEPSPTVRLGDPGTLLQGATPYGSGFIGQAFIGYRFHPLISAGLRAGLRTASASALSDGSTNLSRSSWDSGFYVRSYPLAQHDSTRKYLDPWLAIGVEYMHDAQTFQRPISLSAGASVGGDWTLTHHAVAVPLGVGVDYRILPMLSLGPSFEYTIASGVTGCAKAAAAGYSSNTFCSDQDPGKQVIKAKTYGVWSVGLDLKVTLFE
jgi:hypothetical protein